MKRWFLPAVLLLVLIPAQALAGWMGSIRLARSIDKVAVGKVTVYLQALQHNVHPLSETKVTIYATSPSGKQQTVSAPLDPRFGTDYVYAGTVDFHEPGTWVVKITAEDEVYFPDLTQKVEVLPAGSQVPDPGPVQPFREGQDGDDHDSGDHGSAAATTATTSNTSAAATSTVSAASSSEGAGTAKASPPSSTGSALPWALGIGGVLAVGAAGLMAGRWWGKA